MMEILGLLGIAVALLAGYGIRASMTDFPLLNLGLFKLYAPSARP